jgi:hypothetical protein
MIEAEMKPAVRLPGGDGEQPSVAVELLDQLLNAFVRWKASL